MYEILKEISSNNDWVFDYGRSDFHNLFNEIEQKGVTHLFLDPVKAKSNLDEYGTTESLTYSGLLMLLLSSDIDEKSYEFRKEEYINKLNGNVELLKEVLSCQYKLNINLWDTTEIINVFDYNLDGVIVNYQADINIEDHVEIDQRLFRPHEVPLLLGDPSKAKKVLGWEPVYDLKALAMDMFHSDFEIEHKIATGKDSCLFPVATQESLP